MKSEDHKVKNLGMIPLWSMEDKAMERAQKNGGRTDLYSFGDPIIDDYCGGGYGRKDGYELICLYGGTGMNKSTFASQMVLSPASRGKRVAYLALEDEIEDVINRMHAQVFVTQGISSQRVWDTVRKNIDFFPENSGYSLKSMVETIDKLFETYDVVLIDPVQFIFELSAVERGESEFNRQRVFLNELKSVISKHEKTLIFVSHVNKSAYSAIKGDNVMGEIQGAGQLSQIASKVIRIYRDKDGVRTIDLPKSRFTPNRRMPLTVNLNTSSMRIAYDTSGLTPNQILEMKANW